MILPGRYHEEVVIDEKFGSEEKPFVIEGKGFIKRFFYGSSGEMRFIMGMTCCYYSLSWNTEFGLLRKQRLLSDEIQGYGDSHPILDGTTEIKGKFLDDQGNPIWKKLENDKNLPIYYTPYDQKVGNIFFITFYSSQITSQRSL